ncbi:short-chain fatty acyl-CoA regulator family protein [Devosia rhodophyticola]|uniref:Short-chain fatty acyl-CoA regulator family protein n=1 Tax=Devosia rhodophyticola TaxID=3026423 RepID=A0ABY7YZV1_9HYPH|nr:helix-turn-helix domain-containing protein [Devosia rhodophyticola]WDR06891.1 short-chain fatty acyl-CoA regulator family protein [Devosia rhodophyticola]
MRAPIGIRITSKRKALAISQVELARRVEISPSYLNLIERNKRDVGGALLLRIAGALGVEIGTLTGESEHRLMADVEEAFADPALLHLDGRTPDIRQLVAEQPAAAEAIARLHRAYTEATANADHYADRLRNDPLFSQLLHQILSSITAVRSSAEILEDVPDLDEQQRRRFRGSIGREARSLSEVAHTLIGHFDQEASTRRSASPVRELDDLIYQRDNYFPALETKAHDLRARIEQHGAFGEPTLVDLLSREHGVQVVRSAGREVDAFGFPGQYHFNAATRIMWFQTSAMASTRQFQLTRLLVELSAAESLECEIASPILHSETAKRLGYRALASYLAGAVVFPYEPFLADAEAVRYDIEALRQSYTASFEQVAHRLTTLRRPGAAGVPFGFLRADPAGRLTKHFPLPGLLLPNTGHACPLWAIYTAFRTPDAAVRQIVRFTDGSRYLFLAKTAARRAASFRDRAIHTSVMLACDVLHADRTVYTAGLDLADEQSDLPVGPSCRLCTRRDCPDRQEEALAPGGGQAAVRAPLVPREAFDQ